MAGEFQGSIAEINRGIGSGGMNDGHREGLRVATRRPHTGTPIQQGRVGLPRWLLFVVLDFLELGIDDVIAAGLLLATAMASMTGMTRVGAGIARLCVKALGHLG